MVRVCQLCGHVFSGEDMFLQWKCPKCASRYSRRMKLEILPETLEAVMDELVEEGIDREKVVSARDAICLLMGQLRKYRRELV